MIPWLEPGDPFPPVDTALRDPDGLLAAGLELTPQRILDAYRQGIFPWFSEGQPVLWWSPDPRMVLVPSEIRVTPSMRSTRSPTSISEFAAGPSSVILVMITPPLPVAL